MRCGSASATHSDGRLTVTVDGVTETFNAKKAPSHVVVRSGNPHTDSGLSVTSHGSQESALKARNARGDGQVVQVKQASDESDSFPSEEHVTNDDLNGLLMDVRTLADFNKDGNPGAAEFLSMSPDEQLAHFNDHIIPLWQKHGLPRKGRGNYLNFQDEVKDSWRGQQRQAYNERFQTIWMDDHMIAKDGDLKIGEMGWDPQGNITHFKMRPGHEAVEQKLRDQQAQMWKQRQTPAYKPQPGDNPGHFLSYPKTAAEQCSGSGRASKHEHDGQRVKCDVCGKTVPITQYAAMHKHQAPKTAMPYYHRSPEFISGDTIQIYPNTYFYESDDPRNVDWETRTYGNELYKVKVKDPSLVEHDINSHNPRVKNPTPWFKTSPDNVELEYIGQDKPRRTGSKLALHFEPTMNVDKQKKRFDSAADEAERNGDHNQAAYFRHMRDLMLEEHAQGRNQPFSNYYPAAQEEYGDQVVHRRTSSYYHVSNPRRTPWKKGPVFLWGDLASAQEHASTTPGAKIYEVDTDGLKLENDDEYDPGIAYYSPTPIPQERFQTMEDDGGFFRDAAYYNVRLQLKDGTPEVSVPADIYHDARAHADELAHKHGLTLVEPDRSPDDIGRGNTYLHAYKDGNWVGNIAIEKPGDLTHYAALARYAATLPTEAELNGLQKEFDQWWKHSPLSKTRKPENSQDNWSYFTDQPVTSWRNVEDFLKERHPQAYTKEDRYGVEDAMPRLTGESASEGLLPPEDSRTLANMLMLHNRAQGRASTAQGYQDAGYDLHALYDNPEMALKIVKGRDKMQHDFDVKHHHTDPKPPPVPKNIPDADLVHGSDYIRRHPSLFDSLPAVGKQPKVEHPGDFLNGGHDVTLVDPEQKKVDEARRKHKDFDQLLKAQRLAAYAIRLGGAEPMYELGDDGLPLWLDDPQERSHAKALRDLGQESDYASYIADRAYTKLMDANAAGDEDAADAWAARSHQADGYEKSLRTADCAPGDVTCNAGIDKPDGKVQDLPNEFVPSEVKQPRPAPAPVSSPSGPSSGHSSGGGGEHPQSSGKPAFTGDLPPSLQSATQFAQSVSGQDYDYGGHGPGTGSEGSYDCSGYMSEIYNNLTGKDERFTTDSDFASLGFQPGYDPHSPYNIGTNGGSGEDGHMAGELNGTPVESSGSNGVQYGGEARGATDPMFTEQWHLPADAIKQGMNLARYAMWLTAGAEGPSKYTTPTDHPRPSAFQDWAGYGGFGGFIDTQEPRTPQYEDAINTVADTLDSTDYRDPRYLKVVQDMARENHVPAENAWWGLMDNPKANDRGWKPSHPGFAYDWQSTEESPFHDGYNELERNREKVHPNKTPPLGTGGPLIESPDDISHYLGMVHQAFDLTADCPPGDPTCAGGAGTNGQNNAPTAPRAPGSADASSLDDSPIQWEMPSAAELARANAPKPNSSWGGHANPSSLAGEGGGGGSSSSSSGSSGGVGTHVDYSPSAGVEQWRDEVATGLERNGLPNTPEMQNQVLHQIQTESSGNPNAINNTDSNAQAGHPSQGLLQTIPSTFEEHRLPGDSSNITDPQANVDAAIDYAKDRYGPTLIDESGNGLGSGHGY